MVGGNLSENVVWMLEESCQRMCGWWRRGVRECSVDGGEESCQIVAIEFLVWTVDGVTVLRSDERQNPVRNPYFTKIC